MELCRMQRISAAVFNAGPSVIPADLHEQEVAADFFFTVAFEAGRTLKSAIFDEKIGKPNGGRASEFSTKTRMWRSRDRGSTKLGRGAR
jgi:hypothetical protein